MSIGDDKRIGWVVIILGGFFQVGWSVGLDYTDGMTNLFWDAMVLISLLMSMLCLSIPMRSGINMSTAYAVWVGLGVVLTIVTSALLGIETVTVGMAVFIAVILAGVVGLKLESRKDTPETLTRSTGHHSKKCFWRSLEM